ncbi:MAG: ribosome maturation factor RimM [Casimicrobiaceae bacterium]
MVVLGHVQGAYGVAGWVKVVPYTETDTGLLQYGTWWLRSPGGTCWQARTRVAGRLQGDTVVAQIEGVTDRDAALDLKGSEVAVPRSALPPVERGEIYWADLVGLMVVNRQGQCLGHVRGVTAHSAHPLLQVVGDLTRKVEGGTTEARRGGAAQNATREHGSDRRAAGGQRATGQGATVDDRGERRPTGAGAERDRLIPYVPAVIDAVDLAGRRIEVDWGEDY